MEGLVRANVYLARLDPAKGAELGKLRPVVVLTDQSILDIDPPLVFICPLSSQSNSQYNSLHVTLKQRESLKVVSYALVEHCRAISRKRILSERIAQLTPSEIEMIVHRLTRLIGL